jgi:hypothetical protein
MTPTRSGATFWANAGHPERGSESAATAAAVVFANSRRVTSVGFEEEFELMGRSPG